MHPRLPGILTNVSCKKAIGDRRQKVISFLKSIAKDAGKTVLNMSYVK